MFSCVAPPEALVWAGGGASLRLGLGIEATDPLLREKRECACHEKARGESAIGAVPRRMVRRQGETRASDLDCPDVRSALEIYIYRTRR